jgi:hypothetical protein
MYDVIVEPLVAVPMDGTPNNHGKRASRSQVFCRRQLGGSIRQRTRSDGVHRPCSPTRTNGGRVDRYYDPSTDQFISVDPDLAETDQPYAFTEDDPVNRSDPLGLMPGCGGQVGSCVQSSPGHPEVTVPTPAQLAPVEASEAATAAVESGSNSSTKAVTVVLLPVVVNTCPGDNGCTGPLHMIPYDGPPYNPPLAKPPSGGGFFLIRILNFLSGVLTYADGCATGGSYGVAIGAAIPIADVTGVSELAGGLVGCGVGIYGVQQGGLQPGAPTPDNPTGST